MKRVMLIAAFCLIFGQTADAYDRVDDIMATQKNTPENPWQVSSSLNYEWGDFGTDTTTTTFYMPVTISRYFERAKIAWTIPYINQKSGSNIVAIGGRAYKVNSAPSVSSRKDSGIGDMLLKGNYNIVDEETSDINISGFAQVKLPTADDDYGLGTGEFDETFGVEMSKNLEEFTLYADLGFAFIGEPENTSWNNQGIYLVGAAYQLSEVNSVGLFYEQRTSLIDSESDPRELIAAINYDRNKDQHFFTNALLGVSNSSPDFGLNVGAGLDF